MSDNGSGVSDEVMLWVSACSSKKRRKWGRERDATKPVKIAIVNFENVIETERNGLISTFIALSTCNDQKSYLAGLISVQPVARRRPTEPFEEASLNDFSYEYKVRVVRNGKAEAFKALWCYKSSAENCEGFSH